MRSIAFLAEWIHPPRNHDPKDLQRVHALAFADERCQYQNFQLVPGGATLSNPQNQAGAVSAAVFLPDRVQIREEMTGLSREEFQERMERIAELAFSVLQIQQILVQNFVVRSLVNPRNFYDSREFVARSLLNMEEEDFACLERHPQILGIRFVFPQTPEVRGTYNVRIESYAADPRSLFIENLGVFKSIVGPGNLDDLTSNFFAVYDYIDGNVIDFISQFDAREESPPPSEG